MIIKLFTLLIVFNLLLSCSKNSQEALAQKDIDSSSKKLKNDKSNELLKAFYQLGHGASANLALASILTPDVLPLFSQADLLDSEILQQYLKNRENYQKSLRNTFVFGPYKYGMDKSFISQSLLVDYSSNSSQIFISEKEAQLSFIAYERSKILIEIEEVYLKRIELFGKDVALKVLVDFQSDPNFINSIKSRIKNDNKNSTIDFLRNNKKVINKVNIYLEESGLTIKEQYIVSIVGVAALGIYQVVKDNPTLKDIKNLVAKGIEFKKKIKESIILVKAINDHQNNMVKESRNLFKKTKLATKALKEGFNQVKKNTSLSKEERRSLKNAIHNRLIKGKKSKEKLPTILEQKFSFIDENMIDAYSSASKITNGVSAIVNTTTLLASKLGINMPPEVIKIGLKAKKVGAAISLASSVMTGLASGGILTGLSILGSSSGLEALGLGASNGLNQQILGKLNVIDQMLDQVLKNQQEIMKMQVETMKMIKDLALMVDEYHMREMSVLTEIRDITLVNQAFLKLDLNHNINQCESIVAGYLDSIWGTSSMRLSPYKDPIFTRMEAIKLQKRLRGVEQIRNFIENNSAGSIKSCEKAMFSVFGNVYLEENPVRAILNADISNNLYRFSRGRYLPLLELLPQNKRNTNPSSMALHIPFQNFKSYDSYKYNYLEPSSTNEQGFKELYQIEMLVSAKALMRYSNSLLIFYPYLELSQGGWKMTVLDIINSYHEKIRSHGKSNVQYLLKNALYLVQSSIAQESILSGEPLLHQLRSQKEDFFKIMKTEDCNAVEADGTTHNDRDIQCAVRKNRLLMHNFLSYLLHYKFEEGNGFNRIDYWTAYENKDLNKIQKILGIDSKIELQENNIVIEVLQSDKNPVKIELPSPNSLRSGKIFYSNNMSELIRLHKSIIDALTRVLPQEFNTKDNKIGGQLLFLHSKTKGQKSLNLN